MLGRRAERGDARRTKIDPNCEDMFGQETIAKISMNINSFKFSLLVFNTLRRISVAITTTTNENQIPTSEGKRLQINIAFSFIELLTKENKTAGKR